jgi:Leucine-rich repeat (LRR) protein
MGGGFVGSVPTELGVLSRLRRLDLSRNELIGTIPSQLGDLSRLGM